jgi:16S rRNA (cytosine967-C5)-methyltransferase
MRSGMPPAKIAPGIGPGQKNAQSLVRLRELAVEVLAQAGNSKGPLEEAMTTVLSRESGATFQEFDRSWIFELCSGVLRYRGRVDFIIDTYSLKKKPTGEIRRFLQTGVFQLLAQDTPSALVVSECVQAIREMDGEAPSKFANAILRKVADTRVQWQNWQVSEQSPFEEQLAWCSLPEWLFKKLRKERGSSWTFAFSEAVLSRPNLWYRSGEEPSILHDGFRGDEPVGYVQDISNQLLVKEIIAEMQKFGWKRPRILDLCSAPGGKTLGLASAGYSVISTDIDEDRLAKVRENAGRLNLLDQVRILPHAEIWDGTELYDLIWIDAPCSSTGIIRKHPEIKWNRNWHDVERLALQQEELIHWARSHLTPGGMILYSTCSMLKLENEPKLDSGLRFGRRMEWVPQLEPKGDGIHAVWIEKEAEKS